MASRETPSVEPPWLLMTMPFNPKKYTSIGRFQLSISAYGYQREALGSGAKHRTRNPRIPRSMAHLGSGANALPGMTESGLLRRFRLRSLNYGGQVAPRNDENMQRPSPLHIKLFAGVVADL